MSSEWMADDPVTSLDLSTDIGASTAISATTDDPPTSSMEPSADTSTSEFVTSSSTPPSSTIPSATSSDPPLTTSTRQTTSTTNAATSSRPPISTLLPTSIPPTSSIIPPTSSIPLSTVIPPTSSIPPSTVIFPTSSIPSTTIIPPTSSQLSLSTFSITSDLRTTSSTLVSESEASTGTVVETSSSAPPPTSQASSTHSSTIATSDTRERNTSSTQAETSTSATSQNPPPSSTETSQAPSSEVTSEAPPTSTVVVVTTRTTQIVTVTDATRTAVVTATEDVTNTIVSQLDPSPTSTSGFGDPNPTGSDVSATGQDLPSASSTGLYMSTTGSVPGQMITTTGSYMTYWTTNSNGVPITVTQVVAQGTGALNSDTGGGGNDFFSNTAAVAGVFIVVGISCAAIILFGVFTWLRKRRAKRQHIDQVMASALARQRRTPFDDGPDDDDTPSNGMHGGPEMGFIRSSGTPIPLYDPFRSHPGALQRNESGGSDSPYDPYRPPLGNAPPGNGLNDTSPLSSNDHASGPPPARPPLVGPTTTALPAAYNNLARSRPPSLEDAGVAMSPTDQAGPFEYDTYLSRTPSKGKYAPVSPLPPGAAPPTKTASGVFIGVQDPTPPHSPSSFNDRNSYPYSPMAPAMALTTGPNSKPPSAFRQKRTSYSTYPASPSIYSMDVGNPSGVEGERPQTTGVPPEYAQAVGDSVPSGWYATGHGGQLGPVMAGGSSVGHGSASNHSHSYSITYGNGSNFGWADNDDSNSDMDIGKQTIIEVDQRLDPKSVLMARSKSGDALHALSPYQLDNKSDLSLGSLRDHEDYSRRVLQVANPSVDRPR